MMRPLQGLTQVRLPQWLLPADWPLEASDLALANIHFKHGKIQSLVPCKKRVVDYYDVDGALALPGLVEPHAHLDKTFTVRRSPATGPGLLNAIGALAKDRDFWSAEDLASRAERALLTAARHGVMTLRTHIDWDQISPPLSWSVIGALSLPTLTLERVALIPLTLLSDNRHAQQIAHAVSLSGPGCRLGAFIHSSNWNACAMEHLFQWAQAYHLDLDLHIDEELSRSAQGLSWVIDYLERETFSGHICCSHSCALASLDEDEALQQLSRLAAHNVTIIALPFTNLLLQDAQPKRTPRLRGITLVKEAMTKGIPVLFGADNVQDAFCPTGNYDPIETLATALFTAQLSSPFDRYSSCIGDLRKLGGVSQHPPLQPGSSANLVIFPGSSVNTWPLNSASRQVIYQGNLIYQRTLQEELAYEY
ncbi:cytosine deaminase [Rosenbergiella metrosideri]|uniref:cytosine deaminase n=1 Tax=Rosenbergiella metrosideri TaxID=2921185 RepID=UPI001F4F58B8|nr:cytosine deaminase [Rosenbergiella metrosideri]